MFKWIISIIGWWKSFLKRFFSNDLDLLEIEAGGAQSGPTPANTGGTHMKKAFLVGINKYNDAPLRGCVNDVLLMYKLLSEKFGFDTKDMDLITDHEATKANILAGLKKLISGAMPGDTLYFHFSGHGSQVVVDDWTNSNEADGRDEIICPVDLNWKDPLRDNDLGSILKRVPPGVNVVVILDCCLSAGTKIPLLNGEIKTIKELSEEGGEYWLYSSDEKGNIVPGKAHSARITGYRELIRITLDNDEILECTDDHLILLKSGEYKEAGKLTTEDSLMPLYRKISDSSNGMTGYEMCFEDEKWKFTHHIVRDHFGMKKDKTKTVCHHKDINKLNNAPENLQMVSWEEHQKMHSEVGSANFKKMWENEDYVEWRSSEIYKKQQSYVMKEKWQDSKYRDTMIDALYNSERAKNDFIEERKRMIDMNKDPEISEKQRAWQKTKEGQKKLKKDMLNKNKDPKHQRKCMRARILGFINTIKNLNEYNYKKPRLLPRLENIYKYFNKDENIIELANNYNHKIIKIEHTGRTEEVYDLTVDKYHNFALESGIFVHNCHSGTGLRNSWEKVADHSENDWVNKFLPPPPSNILTNPLISLDKDLNFILPSTDERSQTQKRGFVVETIEQGDAILISGCRDNQTSADAWINGRYQGAMTYYLAETLMDHQFNVSYRSLVAEMNSKLINRRYTQEPQLEGSAVLLDGRFLK